MLCVLNNATGHALDILSDNIQDMGVSISDHYGHKNINNQSLLYCSNSCTSLHFKIILKSHIKTLKIRSYMFRSPLKPSSGGPWPYFARLLNWNVELHLL
jgi:hypothetical protein